MPIFAAPFGTVPILEGPELNAALAPLIAQRSSTAHRDPLAPDPLCFRSREDLFEWPDEAAVRLRQAMLEGLVRLTQAVNAYTDEQFDAFSVQARARFALVRPNGCWPICTVPLATWCAFYCVSAPPPVAARPDSAVLRLYENRFGFMFMDPTNCRMRAPYTPGHHVWSPVAGTMVIFPGTIAHEVALNRADSDLVLVKARVRFAVPGVQELPPW